EALAVALRARRIHIAARGQLRSGVLCRISRLGGTVRALAVLTAPDHAKLQAFIFLSQGGHSRFIRDGRSRPPLKPPVARRRRCAAAPRSLIRSFTEYRARARVHHLEVR